MYKMNYRTDIVNFFFWGGALVGERHLLERSAYFENLTFWRGAYWRLSLIREWALIRSFTVLEKAYLLFRWCLTENFGLKILKLLVLVYLFLLL